MEVEGNAAEKTRAFYIHVFLPWARSITFRLVPNCGSSPCDPIPSRISFFCSSAKTIPTGDITRATMMQSLLSALVAEATRRESGEAGSRNGKAEPGRTRKGPRFICRLASYTRKCTSKGVADFKGRSTDADNAAAFKSAAGHTNRGKLDKAIADLTRPFGSTRTTARRHGRDVRSKGDHDKAIAEYSEAIRLNPKLAYAYYVSGVRPRRKGRIRQSHRRLRARPSGSIRRTRSYTCTAARSCVRNGDFDKALADVKAAIALDPTNEEARSLRDWIKQRTAEDHRKRRASAVAPQPTAQLSEFQNFGDMLK